MVTSDYHIPRGCILFYSKFALAAYEMGTEPIEIISNAGYGTGSKGYESIALQARGVATVAESAGVEGAVDNSIYIKAALTAVVVVVIMIVVIVSVRKRRKEKNAIQ